MRLTDIQEVLQRFEGVKRSGGQYMARCPCHDDRKQSLSIGAGEKGVVLMCQAGCDTRDILARVGLEPRDLFYEKRDAGRPGTTAVYDYPNGVQKLRYSDKRFKWRRPDGHGGWIWNRQGIEHSLYIAGELVGNVAVAEGEKDADNLHRLGFNAVSSEDGAGSGKWRREYTRQLAGLDVVVFQDNDKVGRDYAVETASALCGVAQSVKLLDLSHAWPEIPEHGDVSDLISHFGDDKARDVIEQLVKTTPEWQPLPAQEDPFLSCFKTLNDFEEQEATWLVPGWIPDGQITLLASDGGVGKTSLWINLISALSAGKRCILDPPEMTREPLKTAFLTTEDSVSKMLKRKLRLAGADMANILTPDFTADREGALRSLKFGSQDMERFIRHFKPALCVFDPVQGFVPPDINMGSRNAMRDCMAPLIALGEETGCTFLVVCHTNKRKGVWGRDRIADSADLWDVSRSVLMAGYTEEQDVRYLSNEKNNYAELHDTLLFSIDGDGQVHTEGRSWKRDREFTQEAAENISAPKREDCKAWIINELRAEGGAMPTKELETRAKQAGYSFSTVKRAKDELKADKQVKYFTTGSAKGGDRVWHTQLANIFVELPENEPIPWTN